MKLGSYPPLIIFLDLLFVFLFLFILNTNKVIEIKLPDGKLIDGAEIVFYDRGRNRYYNSNNNNTYIAKSNYTYLDECSNNIIECREALNNNRKAFIVYPKKLQKEISDLVFLSLGTGACKKISLVIKRNGKLDHKKNLLLNKCFKKLHGYENILKESI
jgi:hypothetical protein